jgi:acyl phosphate:glycerol-3-phosphate acyltransferase
MTAVLVVLGGYLLGSMPFGYWLVRLVKGEDIRKAGSGGIGASNVWRAYGRWYGIPVVLLDIAKGFVPAFLGTILVDELAGALAGGFSMLGHWRPLFLGFRKGGKAVATAAGTLFGIATVLGLVAMGLWLTTFLVTRYASVASMVVAVALPFAALVLGEPWPVVVFAVAAAVAVLLLHRPNLARLRAGTESRFRLRSGRAAT